MSELNLVQETLGLKKEKGIGFVPTMGNLHEGHLSLVKESLNNHEHTIVSLFVNPLQFAPHEDFDSYPRTFDADREKLEALLLPDSRLTIYSPPFIFPEGFDTEIRIGRLSECLCGVARPHFFHGVATVVYQLFHLVQPEKAYFGLKDYQQYLIIKKMVQDLRLAVEIVGLPLVRDNDGLALSSRNQYLTSEQKEKALKLPRLVQEVEVMLKNKQDLDQVQTFIAKTLAHDLNWEYLEIRQQDNLRPWNGKTQKIGVFGAYQIGNTRLIDNRLVDLSLC